jgi:hypothetical protein
MILITFDQNELSGLWSFIIIQDEVVRTRTEAQYETYEMADEVAEDCSKAIRQGNGRKEQIKKIINKC